MYFDRGALKRRAKHLVTQGNPPAYMVTLIFLLATTALATVVGLFLPNPVDQVDALYLNWFNTIMENGGEISQGSMNALTQQIMALFQGPMATAALLVALILGFYSMVVSFGYSSYALRVMRGMEGGGYQAPFSQFHMAGKVILIAVLRMVFVYLWTLLFIGPGIIALYRYRMAEYALLDDPEISCLEAIRRCNLERTYGYQLFNGRRRPTRTVLLRLALVLGLEEDEVQRLLKLAGRPVLYARSRADAAVLYGLSHKLSLEETDELLTVLGEESLL